MAPTPERARTRAQRVAARVPYDGFFDRLRRAVFSDNGSLKLAIVALTAAAICAICCVWRLPFNFRLDSKPERDVVCLARFSVFSPDKTNEARRVARLEEPHVYVHDVAKLARYKATLANELQTLIAAPDYESISPENRALLRRFLPIGATEEDERKAFLAMRRVLEKDLDLANFRDSLDRALKPLEKNGVLDKLHSAGEGNQEIIRVYDVGATAANAREVAANDVLIGNAYQIKELLSREYTDDEALDLLFQRIRTSAPTTLTENRDETFKALTAAEERVGPVFVVYEVGQTLARSDKPIGDNELRLLREERKARLKELTTEEKLKRAGAVFALIATMLFSSYALFRKRLTQADVERGTSLAACSIFFGLILATVAVGRAMQVAWDARGGTAALIPILIFVQTVSLAASWGVALTFGSIAAFALALSGGGAFGTFIVFVGTATIVALASRGVRTRSQLIGVAFAAGAGAVVLSWLAEAAGTTNDRAYILGEAAFCGLWALLAGFLTSGLLPIVERVFGVLTPMRLLEYGNPSHPLLLELNRRAPATYNHSIQTAAIAEAAAEAIGARASLIRVGAYFHDVGKMLQPERFTENQRGGYNVHDELEPRMSALVIVAHVKDGVDLAKRYHIPRQIVDLIEQHHGTMLAGFFYQKANEASKDELPAGQQLDEAPFRYPGPIPQSKEAAILMLADAAESASRSMGDVAPGRIENLVRQLVTARLEDGQLNDSGLTLGEIRRVETSMVTSILASRHNRVKYPATAKTSDEAKEPKEAPRDNFRPLSSDVAPTDAYEFVRQPGIAPTSRKEVDAATSDAKETTRNDGSRGGKSGKSSEKTTGAAKKTSKPGAKTPSGKTGSTAGRAYPKNGRKKRK